MLDSIGFEASPDSTIFVAAWGSSARQGAHDMNPGTYRFQLGRFGCIAILDDLPRYPIDMFLTNLSKETYSPLLAARGEDVDFADLPYICLFVDTGALRVLVDTGSGVRSDRPTSGQLLPLLRAHGIQPDQIDLVILTHG